MDKKSKSVTDKDLMIQLEQKSDLVKSISNKIKGTSEYVEGDYILANFYLTDIINFLQNSQAGNGDFVHLIKSYTEQREDLIKLMYVAEMKAKSNNNIPTQKDRDMPYQMINNCILNAEKLKNNDTKVLVHDESSTSKSSVKSISAQDLGIDCEKLVSLYNELLESDEFADILYSNLADLTEQLKDTDKRLSDELERLV